MKNPLRTLSKRDRRRAGLTNLGLIASLVLVVVSVPALREGAVVAGEGLVQSASMAESSIDCLGESCCEFLGLLTDPEAFEQALTGFTPPIRRRR